MGDSGRSVAAEGSGVGASPPKLEATILIVDDTPDNLSILGELLRPYFRIRVATSGSAALHAVTAGNPPDLILLDVMMPGMDGYTVLSRLREQPTTAEVPVIFLTAMDTVDAELQGLAAGAADYIAKPVVPELVLARVRLHLELAAARVRLADQNRWLEAEMARRMEENELVRQVSIRALAHLAEARDLDSGNHILRTQGYVELLARRLQHHPRFAATLKGRYIDLLVCSAPLHDIGKVGIPDHILLKPGPLDSEERQIMQRHAQLGAEAIEQAEQDLDVELEFLRLAKEIARSHHERWDGGGYPDGLAGEAIPIAARIMAVADVFDALISPRVYKEPLTLEQAQAIILAGRGSQFDPDVVDAFVAGMADLAAIATSHRPLP